MSLPDGLYDHLLTEALTRSLADLGPEASRINPPGARSAELLTDLLTRQLSRILEDIPGDDRATRQLEIVNGLLVTLRDRLSGRSQESASELIDFIASPLRLLQAVRRDRQFPTPPEVGLTVPWLFTAGRGSPSLLYEIRRELESCDQADILVSFITVSGVRKLRDVLHEVTARGANQSSPGRPPKFPHPWPPQTPPPELIGRGS